MPGHDEFVADMPTKNIRICDRPGFDGKWRPSLAARNRCEPIAGCSLTAISSGKVPAEAGDLRAGLGADVPRGSFAPWLVPSGTNALRAAWSG